MFRHECVDLCVAVANKLMADPRVFYDDTRLYVMPRERSIDVDDAIDFEIVELLMRKKPRQADRPENDV